MKRSRMGSRALGGVGAYAVAAGASLGLAGVAPGQCTPQWIEQNVSGPPARVFARAAYNPITGRLVIFGGVSGNSLFFNDTWEWNGTVWTRMATTGPSPRASSSMAFDRRTGRVVMHGGYAIGRRYVTFQDTWVWDGSAWTLASTTGPKLHAHASAVDPITGEVMIFSGHPEAGNCSVPWSDDTWAWNGSSWRLVSSSGPLGRGNAAMCLDEARGRVVLFGGAGCPLPPLDDTWEWDGVSWTQRFPVHSPSPRGMAAVTYDRVRQRVLLFGAYPTRDGETWAWDGTDWAVEATSGPSPRLGAVMAYGEALGGSVLFGGSLSTGVSGDTWLYTSCPGITISLPNGAPTELISGEPTNVDVIILPGGDTLVPGSPTLHYRFDANDPFVSSPLVHTGGNAYVATIPGPECTDRPEFYFSARGVNSGLRSLPPDAPATCYEAIAGSMRGGDLINADFAAGLPAGWTAGGLWSVTSSCPPGSGGVGPWLYYGVPAQCTYDTGARNTGAAAGPVIDLPTLPWEGAITLRYSSAKLSENSCPFDCAEVYFNGVLIDRPPESQRWVEREIDLTGLAGQSGRLEFRFDTGDERSNHFRGWHVDNVRLSYEMRACGACYADCDKSTGEWGLDIFDFPVLPEPLRRQRPLRLRLRHGHGPGCVRRLRLPVLPERL